MSQATSAPIPCPQAEISAVEPICGKVQGNPGPVTEPETASRPCPVCGKPMDPGKTSACSDLCRAVKSQRKRAKAQEERERRLREMVKVLAKEAGLTAEDFS